MNKRSVMIVFGGKSSEHDVSVSSAKNIHTAVDKEKYDIKLCYIDLDGHWWLLDQWYDNPDEHCTIGLHVMPGDGSFMTSVGREKVDVDVIFPVLHGQMGEDGTVQGLAQLINIKCVGPSVLSAAVCLDKDMTKRLLEHEGIPVVPWRTWRIQENEPTYDEIVRELGTDVFVKPASAGSSVGVSHVTSGESWGAILSDAASNSELVLIEKTIIGREIEVAVLGNENIEVTEPGEIMPGADFYSFEAKYSIESSSQIRIPAELDETTTATIKNYAVQAYRVVEGRGMARVDFFVTADNQIYVNEINTIPGFTDISMYPKLWESQGVSQTELIDRLISLAIQ